MRVAQARWYWGPKLLQARHLHTIHHPGGLQGPPGLNQAGESRRGAGPTIKKLQGRPCGTGTRGSIRQGHDRFVFVPDSLVDEHDGCFGVEAAGPPGVSRTVQFARGESDEGLDVAQPIIVEGELLVIRHKARSEPHLLPCPCPP